MERIEKGRALILCALICTVIIATIGIKDAKNINAETPEDTANKQVKEITIVTVTPKKVETQEYIDFDLRNLSIVRKEEEEDVVNNSGTSGDGEPAAVTEDSGRDESGTQGYSDDNIGDEYSIGEAVGSEMAESEQEQWSEPEDIVSEDGDGEPMPELLGEGINDPDETTQSVDEGNEDGDDGQNLTYLGTYFATGYCPGSCCCGEYATGYTASGTLATEGRTVACNTLPFGTQLLIDGHIYTVEDTGYSPYGDAWLDIFFESHDSALAFGLRNVEVYLVN